MSTLYPPPIPTYPVSPMATCQLDGGEPLSVAAAVADHTAAFADLETLAADTRAQLEAWERGTRWMGEIRWFYHNFNENSNDNENFNEHFLWRF